MSDQMSRDITLRLPSAFETFGDTEEFLEVLEAELSDQALTILEWLGDDANGDANDLEYGFGEVKKHEDVITLDLDLYYVVTDTAQSCQDFRPENDYRAIANLTIRDDGESELTIKETIFERD